MCVFFFLLFFYRLVNKVDHQLIGLVFSNGTMLSVSDKSDSINERTQPIDDKIKLNILGCDRWLSKV